MSLGVVLPALNVADSLPATFAALQEGGEAFATDIVVADGGSSDGTSEVARRAGARVIDAPRGRGIQLAAGARAVAGDWLLFLHADTSLEPGWADAVRSFLAQPEAAGRAAYFRFRLDDDHPGARRIERWVAWRCCRFALPYGDQGLLLARSLYDALDGYAPIPLMEDVDLVRRIVRARGRGALVQLEAAAQTSAARYRQGGYWRRPARNLACLSLWFAGVSPATIARLYR
ncbi:MAG: TIGR04283 family arsenosugar biosynthesis glycosyltransferase [Alphaproteobacteria bacterium]|nr:TIGR04283 family arsenosugar biosynthesis glycosyltransferase [Alphaproteobacteria bacterium]